MNRDQALSRFVGESLRELTDSSCTRGVLKELRQRFADRHHLESSARFTNADVASEVVRRVSRVRQNATSDEVVDALSKVPYIVEVLSGPTLKQTVEAVRLGKESTLSLDELSKAGREEYLDRVERELAERARSEAGKQLEMERSQLSELRQRLESERKSIEAITSVLDDLPVDLEVDSLVEHPTLQASPGAGDVWWRDLGLEGDPFASNQGLSQIPEAKFDSIVVQTPKVKSYLDRLEKSPNELFGKTIVLLGEFGSGKTTLFQLLAHRAGRSRLIPVLAFINPEPSLSRLMHQLTSQILETTRGFARHDSGDDLSAGLGSFDEIGKCAHMMAQATESRGLPGHILFIDGLHKSLAYQQQSLEFLQHIQNFQERLSNSGVRTGILVAGSPAWRRELEANPSLSGSFYGVDEIPPLEEENAVEAVMRRIQNYVPPSLPNPRVDRERLRSAFRILSGRLLHPPTFRLFLDHVRDRLVAHESEELGISLAAHREVVEAVRKEILKSPLSGAYARLVDPRLHPVSFLRALAELAPAVYVRKGFVEADPKFQANRGVFQALRKGDFIALRRAPHTNSPIWVVSPLLLRFLSDLQERLRIPPSETMTALFAYSKPGERLPSEAETIYSAIKADLQEMAASWRASWPEIARYLEDVRSRLTNIERVTEQVTGFLNPQASDDVRTSTVNLVRAIQVVGAGQTRMSPSAIPEFEDAWYAPENSEEIARFAGIGFSLPGTAPQGWGSLQQHAAALSDLTSILSDLIRGEGVCRLSGRLLTAADAIQLHRARLLFLNQRYDAAIDGIAGAVDSKLKDLIYPILRFAYGGRFSAVIPKDITDKLRGPLRGHPRTQRDHDHNFMYDVSRSDYPKIIYQKTLRQLLWGSTMTEEQIERLHDDSALIFSLADREAHRDRPIYYRGKSTEIASALQAAPRICELLNRTLHDILSGPGFEGRQIDKGAVEVQLCAEGRKLGTFRIAFDVAKALGREILERADAGTLDLPPVDETCSQAYADPEVFVGMLRVAIGQGFIQPVPRATTFGFTYSLTAAGRERLSHARRLAG